MNILRKRPRVSVGIPLYNQEKYVAATIEAHLNQTYGDFELIISDNHSTDRSADICREYARKDSRIKFSANRRNLGPTRNFLRCFELATGEFFRWNPSDDLVSLNLLERAIEILDHDRSVFVAYGRTKLIGAQGDVISDFDERLHLMSERPSDRWKAVKKNIRLGNLPYGLSRSDILRKTGLLRNYMGGDFPFIAEMSLYGKFYEMPDAFFYRRMHEEASSALNNSSQMMAFYDPENHGKFFLYNWVHLGARLKAVHKAPISLPEKLRIYGHEGRSLVWSRKAFARELSGAVCQLGRRLTR